MAESWRKTALFFGNNWRAWCFAPAAGASKFKGIRLIKNSMPN
jgi:hypothetical protein